MAPREPSTGGEPGASPKSNRSKGFSVGPANLPDGTYRRRVQKIKKDLIHRAKVRRSYEKIKAREAPEAEKEGDGREGSNHESNQAANPATLEPHPSRQIMMGDSATTKDSKPQRDRRGRSGPKPNPFYRESLEAQRAREAAEEEGKANAAAQKQRAQHQAQRERWQREMAKARGQGKGGAGKRKLGRESKVLLEKVQRLIEREKEHG